ncbi:MAG: UDP-3-O-acyl-N-acetylglucosamine deacetylase [Sinimarinibacterium flocculans]|uniref:UDP-3-O-acyl-N-acetylglucosamine deacetylase n=1 Tax=Sinimarinibacterium flocculans TaxID=985250 RepID=A0A318EFJ8_9GAMM|nr:UDP-3-O-acyl-N-acetylglucosamine deacetylase [Sinimarinibacterium flocculans]PXV69519.1 UDP-3-O-[3-hydroxymyristoyl] N-acetylglucosamine deacetylase [Sinimarinibacterium flocculans]
MVRQRTLKQAVRASGIGLHSGRKVYMSLLPAGPDTGIVFRRTDLQPVAEVPADAHLLREAVMCSTLVADDGAKVMTIEHLMSAFAGLGIDNCIVELSSPEVPIMDGSSGPFVFLIQSTGIHEQDAPKRFLRIRQPVQVADGDKWARFEPFDGFRLSFSIDFRHPAFRASAQSATVDFSTVSYIGEVSRARTFGFMRELDTLRAANLGLGASLDNVVALDDYRVVNHDGLRYDNEFVRHKILDAVGDLYLLGHPVIGAFTAYKSGHALNNKLVRAVLEDPAAYEIVTFEDAARPAPISFVRGAAAAA